MAVYPFTAQPAITQALLTAAECPVFVGVGGGTTQGKRSVQLAAVSEMQGAAGVIVNSPASAEMVSQIVGIVDIPVIATVVRPDDAHAKVRAGAKIINVAAGRDTPAVLRELRAAYPTLPLIATGGKTHESVIGHDPRRRERHHLDPALGADAPSRHDAALPQARGRRRASRTLNRPGLSR